METKRQVGARISAFRKQRGLTQEDLASKTGRSVDAISNIERGKSYPSFEMIEGLVRALNMQLEDLIVVDLGQRSPKRVTLVAGLRAAIDELNDDDLRLALAQIEAIRITRMG